jgi:hypothetical protein
LTTIATPRPAFLASGLIACCALGALFAPLAAAETSLTFTEPEQGSTFEFIDAPPLATVLHQGFPSNISPGDVIVITNPLKRGSKTIGKLRATCTATAFTGTASNAAFTNAHFICEGIFFLGKSKLFADAAIVKGGTEGVITGGTIKYAGAQGTFLSKEVKGGSLTTIAFIG